MVNKTTSFMKKGKGKKGSFNKNGNQVATPIKKPIARPKPETGCFYCKGNGHWKRNCPKYLADKKAGNTKGICDIDVIDVYLTSTRVAPGYLIPVQLLTFVTQSRSCGISGDWRRTRWRCASGMVPRSM